MRRLIARLAKEDKTKRVEINKPCKETVSKFNSRTKGVVLLWEISSGRPPFKDELYDGNLIKNILQGYRETIVLDTFADYSNLYTECWSNEPGNRPTLIENVLIKILAADLGNIKAIFNLAVMHQEAIAIKDDTKSFELSKKSVEGGSLGGMTMLGHCYQHGIGVDVNM
ncbi:hypothetical protein C1646_772784 [Rhizophagus diaphanus]|nr:hypothetical protein C1646_772784 [Rhizophagus diaphanus] [Rhizophagus sp. MUCL 43196]